MPASRRFLFTFPAGKGVGGPGLGFADWAEEFEFLVEMKVVGFELFLLNAQPC